MRVVGLTGGIGSGKSTTSRIAYDLGARLINADKLSRKIVRKGSRALNEIVEYFGEEIINEKGILNRKKLAEIVFKNREKLNILNEITHKYVADEIKIKLEKIKDEENPEVVILEVPIPVENGFLDVSDEIWVIISEKEKRIERIMQRNKSNREEALERISMQMTQEEYMKIADQIIENNGSIEELEQKIAKLYMQVKTR